MYLPSHRPKLRICRSISDSSVDVVHKIRGRGCCLIRLAEIDQYPSGECIDLMHEHDLISFLLVVRLIDTYGINPQPPRLGQGAKPSKHFEEAACDRQSVTFVLLAKQNL